MQSVGIRRGWFVISVAVLLVVLFCELFFSVRQNSQTFDESAHIYAGYSYWKRGDFGINPEHPPLAKMVGAIPLLGMHLDLQPPPPIFFRAASSMGGFRFLYTQDADTILLRARMAMMVFTFALALLVLFAAREMFGDVAALIALLLFVFGPNILANGALVGTDMAVSAMLFATVYAFYRYTRKPTAARLLVCAVAAGLALGVKHSALIVFPLLVLLAAGSVLLDRKSGMEAGVPRSKRWGGEVARMIVALLVISAVSFALLWAAYGFRYAARPGNAAMTPPTAAFLATLHRPLEARTIGFAEHHHLLPEAYLYGLTDVTELTNEGRPMFVLGKIYSTGKWFYFPATFLIKSTIGFLLLLALALVAAGLWRRERARELMFMVVPAAVYLGAALLSKMNIGHRHILPAYAFLIVLTAAGAALLMRRSRVWAGVVVVLLAFHVVSSARAYPAYLAYSNEVWGGPSQTWKVLTDANTGWDSGLKPLQRYVREKGIRDCWLAYDGPADVSYFKLPCKPLPTFFSMLIRTPQGIVPEQIHGPIFIGSLAMSGFGFGPGEVNPYQPFWAVKPDDVIQGELLVYNGTFDVRRVAALSHAVAAGTASQSGQPGVALAEAQRAETLAPEFLGIHEMLSQMYAANHQPAEASREYATAMQLYKGVYAPYAHYGDAPVDPSPAPAGGSQTANVRSVR